MAILLAATPARPACDPTICGASPCTINGTHDIDAGCTLDWSGKAVTVAQNAVLRNLSSIGGFTIRAKSLTLNGTLRFPNGAIWIDLETDMNMPTATSVIDTAGTQPGTSGEVDITAGGTVTLNRVLANGVGYGGWIQVYGKNVSVPGTLQATADGQGGDIWLEADQDITIAGTVNASATGSTMGDAGRIGIEPSGKLRVTSSGSLRATGVNGGTGGEFWIMAGDTATFDGVLNADGTGADAYGGDVTFDAASITSSGDWSANGGTGAGAAGGVIYLTAGVGNLVTTGTTSMNVVSATGGGEIWTESAGDTTLAGDFNATASGTDSVGGRIGIWAWPKGSLVVSGSLDVTSSAATGTDGQIQLGACNVILSGQLKANAHADGQNVVLYRGAFVVTPSGRMVAGATGRNLVQCRCLGGNPNAMPFPGTCPASPTCAVNPVKQGSATVTPAFTAQPTPLHPCACFDQVQNGTETGIDCGGGTCRPCFDGLGCASGADCVSGVCTGGVCTTSCNDTVKNGDESDTDCGGFQCTGCPIGKPCRGDWDCADKNCDFQNTQRCLAPTCTDRNQNGAETDKNCGGGTCPACTTGKGCKVGSDCASKVCHPMTLLCLAPTCSDQTANDVETDKDCGGGKCGPCDDLLKCKVGTDCKSKVCNAGTKTCDPPSCTDGQVNGTETDLGCGGGACPGCNDGKICVVDSDCKSKVCDGGRCQAPTCTDRATNGAETGKNCGGGTCPACPDGQPCKTDPDCLNQVCDGNLCREPDCMDTRRNEQETDVDCGGAECQPCADAKICKVDTDCKSDVCDPTAVPGVKRCAAPTCTDRAENDAETDKNCGGPCTLKCDDLLKCKVDADCKSKVCGPTSDPNVKRCAVPTCTDAVENGAETDKDCGGPLCGDCDDKLKCKVPEDCKSKVCNLLTDPSQLRCAVPSCTDGARNGAETDADCGGGTCKKCKTDEGCQNGARDCVSGVCGVLWWACRFDAPTCSGWCRDPSCKDGVQNGDETGFNCGGSTCPRCPEGQVCKSDDDCLKGLVCSQGAIRTCVKSCPDGVQNGTETDLDCGGGSCPPCLADRTCKVPSDCATNICTGTCRCPDQSFTFTVDSSQGTWNGFAMWPGDLQMQESPGTGCRVWINNPDNVIHLTCGTIGTRPFSVEKPDGFSSCSGRCGDVSCNLPASYGQCCFDRPSCSSALNGTASAKYFVDCKQ